MTEVDLERDGLRWPRRACALALLAAIGCGDSGVDRPASGTASGTPLLAHAPRQAEVAWARPLVPPTAEGIQPTGLMSLPSSAFNEPELRRQVEQPALPELVPLPTVEAEIEEPASPADDAASATAGGPTLLPPQPISESFTEWEEPATPLADASVTPTPELPPPPVAAPDQPVTMPPTVNVTSDEQGQSLSPEADELLADAGATVTGHPTGAVVSEQAQAKIRRGYKLAQRGAYFAARAEFVETLRMIAEAKDQKRGASRRSTALANGLRALDEAADFAPRGTSIESRLDIDVIIASHRTPVAKEAGARLLPQQLSDLYYRYAQLQLGAAVAGEPAGSMALHALGKLYSQVGRAEPQRIAQAERRAFALQQAALLARSDNHLAAHELGVLLAEMGHLVDSEYILAQVASREPHPVVYRNLARIQRKLGREELALASEQQARVLTEQGVSSVNGIVWVDPQTMARTGDPLAPSIAPSQVASGPPVPQPRRTQPSPYQDPAPSEPVHNVTRLPGGYFR